MSLVDNPVKDFPASEPVSAWTLSGRGGLEITVLTYGGIVSRLTFPDRAGHSADLVLGFAEPARYAGDHPYFGAIAGRIAGRVTAGELVLDGERYSLPLNDPPNHLHGGPCSIDRQIWKATPLTRDDGAPSLKLTRTSPDGENGYPGSVVMEVTYTVTDDNRFLFETLATSDRPTPVSLTHHSYFNLAGENAGSTLDHHLQIPADEYFEADDRMGLTGRKKAVESGVNDFRDSQRLGDFVSRLHRNHGDLYWLGEPASFRPVAHLLDPSSGRRLTVSTDCRCLQFYTGVSLDGSLIGKSGQPYREHAGLCLECEGHPNAFSPQTPFGSILVAPERPQTTRTEYHFSTDAGIPDRRSTTS